MIKPGKAKVAKLPEKDPNETLLKHGRKVIINSIWQAQPWNPAGIVVGEEIWEQFVNRQAVESVPYPPCLDGLNTKLKGIRQGEITLFTSGTGSGFVKTAAHFSLSSWWRVINRPFECHRDKLLGCIANTFFERYEANLIFCLVE